MKAKPIGADQSNRKGRRFMHNVYQTIECIEQLKQKYPHYIKPELISVALKQTSNDVCIDTIESVVLNNGFEKQTHRSTNLNFITDGAYLDDERNDVAPLFSPSSSIELNVKILLEDLCPVSMINTIAIFHDKAIKEISEFNSCISESRDSPSANDFSVDEDSRFILNDDDCYAIEMAKKYARRFLNEPSLKPTDVVGLRNALYALERLPDCTPGICCTFGITYESRGLDYSGRKHIMFSIREDEFEIDVYGTEYDPLIGSDAYTEPGYYVKAGGYRKVGCELFFLDDDISEYMNMGATFFIEDESSIEFY